MKGNFRAVAREWFGEDLSGQNFSLLPLSFASPSAADVFSASLAEKRFLKYLHKLTSGSDDNNTTYSVAIKVKLLFQRSEGKEATKIRVTHDPNSPTVYLTEEDVRKQYPWYYRELTRQCVQRYADFKVDHNYHRLRKKLGSNPRFGHIRLLDPTNPKSSRKPFFNAEILVEFDKHYTRMVVDSQPGAA